ncbi:hypothetical protein BTUL_0051g00210 [Botrytis tulipae]|uniref:Uncharacterized protein n=1 Tax=Botrytis tulipae TaxID=87230 RepID=A0A4Z1EQE6_9HELO|nr:hypothetical protein BTUL_0051g00210 [Botrytis tulipae]
MVSGGIKYYHVSSINSKSETDVPTAVPKLEPWNKNIIALKCRYRTDISSALRQTITGTPTAQSDLFICGDDKHGISVK